MKNFRKIKLNTKPISIVKLIPNILTICGLCIGLLSIRFALDDKWEYSLYCILTATLIDGIDGRVARLLNASSPFGAELDSLSDFVNFGISPVLITYLWIYDDYNIKVISWSAVMFYAVCTSLRLARFNTVAAIDNKINKNGFFVGIPSPIAALIVLFPLINEFGIKNLTEFTFRNHSFLIAVYQFFIGFLMTSRLPTFSFKDIKIQPHYMSLLLLSFAFIAIFLFLYTWYVVPAMCFAYILTIPFSCKTWRNLNKDRESA